MKPYFESDNLLMPFGQVQHVEKFQDKEGQRVLVVMKPTRWNFEQEEWDNPVYVMKEDADRFLREYKDYLSYQEYLSDKFTLVINRPDVLVKEILGEYCNKEGLRRRI